MSSYSFQGSSRVWIPRDEEENRAIFSAMRQETGIKMPNEFKPVYLENEEYEVEKWSTKQLIRLIRLLSSHRCLWDPSDPYNKNRKMRRAALVDISAALGDDVTIDQVVQKINVVRSTYRYEKRRIKQRIRKGIGPKTKLKWFALADSFLRKIPRLEKFRKNDLNVDSDSDLEDTCVFSIDPGILVPLDEEGESNQNHITIADNLSQQKTTSKNSEINEKMNEIHKILEKTLIKQETSSSGINEITSDRSIIRFLKIYRKYKCLYDLNVLSFKSKVSRNRALKAMAKKLGGKTTSRRVARDIKKIHSIYKLERLKRNSSYKWFPLADSFLRPFYSSSIEMEEKCMIVTQDDQSKMATYIGNGISIKKEENLEDSDNYKNTKYSGMDCDNLSNIVLKEEMSNNIQHESPEIQTKHIRRPWKQTESLRFVELYKNHPCLWNDFHCGKPQERIDAIESISKNMDISVERIWKRVNILKREYAKEKGKIIESPEYKTNLVWFELADSFLSTSQCVVTPTFVDTNALPPPTPLQEVVDDNSIIKKESPLSNDDFYRLGMNYDINPIPSVENATSDIFSSSPCYKQSEKINESSEKHSIEFEIPQQYLTKKISGDDLKIDDFQVKTEFTETCSDTTNNEKSSNLNSVAANDQPTKLILNGLEDDLLECKWSLKHSVQFLRLYGAHRCLWDLNDPDFRCRELRNAAINDIAAAMGNGQLDYKYVAKKIKIFRITYMQHRKRMLEAIKAGQEPEIQLKWFPLADSFLRPHIGLRSIKANEKEMPQFDFQYVYANLNLIDPSLLNDIAGKGTQNSIEIGPNSSIVSNSCKQMESIICNNDVENSFEGEPEL